MLFYFDSRSEFFAALSHDLKLCRLFDELCAAEAEAVQMAQGVLPSIRAVQVRLALVFVLAFVLALALALALAWAWALTLDFTLALALALALAALV